MQQSLGDIDRLNDSLLLSAMPNAHVIVTRVRGASVSQPFCRVVFSVLSVHRTSGWFAEL